MMTDILETDQIERELAETRARMDNRLGELQNHFTPKQMINDVLSHFRGGEGADFTKDMIARAKANPVPVALAGIGIAWLMASTQTPGGSLGGKPRYNDLEERLRVAEGNVHRFDHDDDDSYASRLDDARAKVVGLTRDASDSTAAFGQRVKDAVAKASQGLRETTHDLTSGGVGQYGVVLKQGTQDMANSARTTLGSVAGNPFALGGIAALAGLVAGALLPVSEQERRVLGSTATKLRAAGGDLAQDMVDRGGHIATDTLEAIKGSAQAHGLSTDKPVGEILGDVTNGDLLGNVKAVAQEALQAGKDSVQTHLASGSGSEAGQQPG